MRKLYKQLFTNILPGMINRLGNPVTYAVILAFMFLSVTGVRAQYTSGNLFVLRIGDGTNTLTSSGNALFIDEYTTSGTLVSSTAVPSSGTNALITSGSAGSEGFISLSPNGLLVAIPGYNTATGGGSSLSSTTSASVNRGVGTIDPYGFFNLAAKTSSSFSANNIRGAATDGNGNYWACGGATGVVYMGTGTAATIYSSITNNRCVQVINGKMYVTTAKTTPGLYTLGTPATSGTSTATTLMTLSATKSDAGGFAFNTALTYAYIADDGGNGNQNGIVRYKYNGTSWAADRTISTDSARGLSVDWSNPTKPVIYATVFPNSGNLATKIVKYSDDVTVTTGTVTGTKIVTAGSLKGFGGITFALRPASWTSSSSTGNWSTASNWSVINDNNINLSFQNVNASSSPLAITSTYDNSGSFTKASSITFTSGGYGGGTGGTQYTLAGSTALHLTGNTYTGKGVINNSSYRQVINFPVTLDSNETFNAASGILSFGGNIALGSNTLTLNGSNNDTLKGVISGTGGLAQSGTGTSVLTGTNTYTGTTNITAGNLLLTGSLSSSSIVTVSSGATLSGNGTVGDSIIVNGTVSPGNVNPSTLASGSQRWNGGGQYTWYVNDATLSKKGTDVGYSWLNITGSLNISATSASKFKIKLSTLTTSDVSGTSSNFTNTNCYQWIIASASSGITGFAANKFTVDTTGFQNTLPSGSYFSVSVSGNNLILTYHPSTVPAITSGPSASTICANGNTSFSVSASGSGISYQWYVSTNGGTSYSAVSNGGVYSGATTSSLGLTSATALMNSNQYYVVLKESGNSCDSNISTSALLTVNTAPSISANPSNQTVCGTSSVSYSVTAGGTNLNYIWQENQGSGFSNLSNGGAYSNVTTSTLGISTSTAMNGYHYRVIISNTGCSNDTSSSALLTDNTGPVITTNPANDTICSGNNASFSGSASGTSLNYQWQESTNGGSTWGNITNGGVYSGATSTSLTLTGITSTYNSYQYRLSVSNSGCSGVTSTAATVFVQTAPSVGTSPHDSTTCSGNNASFTVSATGTSLSYQWQESTNGGTSYSNISNGGIYSGATSSVLLLTAPGTSMSTYKYRCVVSNHSCSSATSTGATLTIQTAPSVGTNPGSSTICSGNNATFSVSATGSSLSYQWQENTGSSWANVSNGGVYSGATSSSLLLTAPGTSMSTYQYRCVVSNTSCSSATTTAATLTIQTAPSIGTNPSGTSVTAGSTANFSVSATGSSLLYQWQESTNSGSTWNNLSNAGIYSGVTTNAFSISSASSGMNGYEYRVVVSNTSCSSATSTAATLTVTGAAVATLYWDADSSHSTTVGGAGHWNNYAKVWRNGSTTGTLGKWISGSNAVLPGTAGAITMDSDMIVNTIEFAPTSGGYNIGGGSIKPGTAGATNSTKKLYVNGGTIKVSSTTAQYISCVLATTSSSTDITIVQNNSSGITLGLAGPSSAFSGKLNLGDGTGTATNGDYLPLYTQNAITSCSQINVNDPNSGISCKKYLDLSILQKITLNQNIHLNNTGLSGSFITYIGATASDTFVLNGVISGSSDVWFQDGNATGGSSPIYLNAANTWTGRTVTSMGPAGILQWGVNNALPTTTRLFMGDTTASKGTGELDLHGHNQSLVAINSGSNTGAAGITNNTSTNDTLFLTGNQYGTMQNSVEIGTQTLSGLVTTGTNNMALVMTSTATGTLTVKTPNTYSKGTIINGGTLQLSTSNNRLSTTGAITVGGGTLNLGTVTQTAGQVKITSGTITGSSGNSLSSSTGFDVEGGTISANLGGTAALTKSTTSTATIASSSVNTYTGTTSINAGTLAVSGSTSTSSAVTVAGAGTLTGNGNLQGTVLVDGTVEPGTTTTPVTLSTGALTLDTNGVYIWNINDATGTKGANTGWDWVSANGAVTINATSSKPYVIKLIGANTVAHFSNLNSYNWIIATGTSVSGFAANKFTIDTTGFTNNNGAGAGTWAVAQVGNSIEIQFTGGNPSISVTSSSISFGDVPSSSTSASQNYSVSGTFLTPTSGNITVTAPAGFEVSLSSGSGYGTSVNAAYTGGTLSATTIYTHFIPNALTSFSGNITNSGGGATTKNVALSGQGIAAEPTTQSSITFGTVGTNSLVVNFTGGNGQKRLLLINGTGSVSSNPADGTTYSGASSVYAAGTSIGTGNYIVYNGTGSTVTVIGLHRNHTYYFSVYEYNDSSTAGAENYLTPGCTGNDATITKSYVWSGGSTGSFTTAANWTPNWTSPDSTDVMQFNASSGSATVDNVPTMAIGQLQISGSDSIALQALATGDTLSITNGTGLNIAAGSSLSLSSTNKLSIIQTTGVTGDVYGRVHFYDGAQTLQSHDASSLTFHRGASCTAETGFTGNPFGKVDLNSVVFNAGAEYISKAGSDPFGASKPSTCVVFQSGSWYSHQQTTALPNFNGRTYANVEFNTPGASITNLGGASVVNIDTLTMTSITLLDFGQAGGINIHGDININSGTLTFDSLASGAVTFNGGVVQNVYIGDMMFSSHSAVTIASGTTLYIQDHLTSKANITVSGSFENGGYLTMDYKQFIGTGTYSNDSGSTTALRHATGLAGLVTVSGTKTFNTKANYLFQSLTSQSLGFSSVGATAAGDVDMTVGGTATLDGTSYTLTLNGTMTVEAGTTLSIPNGNNILKGIGNVLVNGSVKTQSANGFSGSSVSGASFEGFNPSDFTMAVTSVVTYNGTAQSVTGQVFYPNLTIAGTGTKTMNADVTVDSMLVLNAALAISGNQLTLNGPAISGTATNLSSTTGSSLAFGGNSTGINIPSTISDLSKLTVNNGQGVSMHSTINIGDTLNVNNGILNTDTTNSHKIILGGAAQMNETTNGYVMGIVQTTRTVSTGVTNAFGGIGVSVVANGSTAPGSTLVTRTTGAHASTLYSYNHKAMKGINMIWDIDPTNNGHLAADLTFTYNPNLLNGVVDTSLNVFVDHTGSGIYNDAVRANRSLSARTVTAKTTDSFSSWTLGGSFSNPLPVEMVSFDAALKNETTSSLTWTTASEINNDKFEIQRSEDGKKFIAVGEEAGHGTTNTVHNYSYEDVFGAAITSPVLYYRLKQMDFNGAFMYSEIRKVVLVKKTATDNMKAWFNRDMDKIQMLVNASKADHATIRIVDMNGQILSQKDIDVSAGSTLTDMDMNGFAKGMYMIVYISSETSQAQRILKY